MMTLRAALAHLLLPRYASGSLPPVVARWVHAGIEEDPGVAEAYTALRRLERQASRAATSAGQRELLEGALFAGLARDDEGDPRLATSSKAPWALLPRAAPFAAAAASLAIFLVVGGGEGYGAGDLQARGAALSKDPLGVKVTCLKNARVIDTATAGARRPSDRLTCPADGMLAFAMTNLSATERYVFVVGIAADGSTRWYAPFDRTGEALRVPAGNSNEVLPMLGDLRGMPNDERVSLHVLLSDRPFSAEEIERQISGARTRGVPLSSLERLPLPDVPVQARVDMVRPQ